MEALMKKYITIAMIGVLVVVGAYTGFWYISAASLKNEIIGSLTEIKHDGIALRGFPLNIEVSIKNPNWVNEPALKKISTDGSWVIGLNILGTDGWFEMSGSTKIEALTPGSAPGSEGVIMSGFLRYDIDQRKKWREQLKKDPSILTQLKTLSRRAVVADKFAVTLISQNQPFLEADHISFKLSPGKEETPYSMASHIQLDMLGFSFYTERCAGLVLTYNNLAGLLSEAKHKTDYSLDAFMQYSKPENDDIPISLEIKNLTSTNALYSSAIQAKLEMGATQPCQPGGQPHGSDLTIAYNAKYIPSEQLPEFSLDQQALISQYRAMGIFSRLPELEKLFTAHWDQVAAFLEGCTVRKPVETQLYVTCQFRNDPATGKLADLSCDLQKFAIKMDPYEINLNGYKGFQGSSSPSFLDIRVTNYQQLTNGLAKAYNQLQQLLTSTQTVSENEMPPINGSVVSRVTDFIAALSAPDVENSCNLHIVVGEGSDKSLTIGPYGMSEFDTAFKQLAANISTEMLLQVHQKEKRLPER